MTNPDKRATSGMNERIRAAIRMLYPDEMTPAAKRILENILDEEEQS